MTVKSPAPKKAKKKAKTKPRSTSEVDTRSGLTKKELKFCQEYMLDFNAPRAARDTGISQESRWADKLLKRKLIQDEIERLGKAVTKKLKIGSADVAAGLFYLAKKCSQKGKGYQPKTAVMAYSRLGAYTGDFREQSSISHKHSISDGRKDFSKMSEEELDKFIENERASRNPK